MSEESIQPEKENLRKAVAWISEQGKFSLQIVDEASIRFDLAPVDESFLIRHFTQEKK